MKKLFLTLVSLLLPFCANILGDTANVAPLGTAYSNADLWPPGNFNISQIINRNPNDFLHADAVPPEGIAYSIDLGKAYSISQIKIWPRQDGCCPDRFSKIRVSVHSATETGEIGAEVWGTDLFADGSNPGATAGTVVTVDLPSPQTGRWVQLKSIASPPGAYAMQMSEVEVYAEVPPGEVNRAYGKLATSNRPLWDNRSPSLLVDGAYSNSQIVHGLAEIEPGFAYTINLGAEVTMSKIVIIPRRDGCCPERLSNYRVSVHRDNNGTIGDVVWSADMRTDGSNPGSDPTSIEVLEANLDPDGTFKGQYVKIESLDNPVTQYALQMSEVEVYGTVAPGVNLLLTQDPRDVLRGVGQTANFTVAANAVNGDPNLITYQWQKNGVDIQGATGPSYTTPLLFSADSGNKYRVIVGYPGRPSITSKEATLTINYAQNGVASANAGLWFGTTIGMINDGLLNNFVHALAAPPAGLAYQIRLPAVLKFNELLIYPRQDGCCPDRFSNVRVSIHDDNNGAIGQEVWSTDLFTDGTNPGSSPGSVVRLNAGMDPDGKFEGQWIKLTALGDPLPDYALQVSDVQAFGTLLDDSPKIVVTQQPGAVTGSPGRTATMRVGANIFNGDPSLLKYQWQKNGVNITGATEATYTTPLLTSGDANAKYRVVLSYPGIPDVISNEASLTFDYNYARGSTVTANGPIWGGGSVTSLVDGNRNAVFHGSENPPVGFAYFVNMGTEVTLERIDIYPRQDVCCPERFTNLRVSVHKDNNGQIGDQVWSTDLFTDGSNPGSGPGTLVTLTPDMDPAGQFKGQWIRIMSLDEDPADYALQMNELEAIGKIQEPLILTLTTGAGGPSLSWTEGVLESATEVIGAQWSNVNGATSPYQIPANEPRRFYRLRK